MVVCATTLFGLSAIYLHIHKYELVFVAWKNAKVFLLEIFRCQEVLFDTIYFNIWG